MSWKGVWKTRGDSTYFNQTIHRDTPDGGYIEIAVDPEYIEDDGHPFEEGEEVEILVRRVDREKFYAEDMASRRDASDF
jgi:hypothetical protein